MAVISRIIGLVLLLAAALAPAAEQAAQDIGWVLEYAPDDALHKIRRVNAAEPIQVKLGTPLRAGDVINVEKNGRVLIGLADGSEREVAGNGSWSVPETAPRPALFRVMQSMLGLIERHGAVASSAVTKGGECVFTRESKPIDVPVLASPQKIVAGTAALSLAWRGGCPPYALTLESRGRKLTRLSGVEEARATFAELLLQEGTLVVRIRESRGRDFTSRFEVVKSAPQPPADLATSSSTLGALAEAMWLSEQEGGAWKLESVRKLELLAAQRHPVAAQFKDALLSIRPDSD